MSRKRSPGLRRSLRQIMSSLSRWARSMSSCQSVEVGAGIDHLPIEEEPVEGVRDVVVVGNIGLVGTGRRRGRSCRRASRRAAAAVRSAPARTVRSARNAFSSPTPLSCLPIFPRTLRRKFEDRTVLEVEEPGDVDVDQRIEAGTPYQSRDDALAADRRCAWRPERDPPARSSRPTTRSRRRVAARRAPPPISPETASAAPRRRPSQLPWIRGPFTMGLSIGQADRRHSKARRRPPPGKLVAACMSGGIVAHADNPIRCRPGSVCAGNLRMLTYSYCRSERRSREEAGMPKSEVKWVPTA